MNIVRNLKPIGRSAIRCLACFLLLSSGALLAQQSNPFPNQITYHGNLKNQLNGSFSVTVHYFDRSGEVQVAKESFEKIGFVDGTFTLNLGSGKFSSYPQNKKQHSLNLLVEENYDLLLHFQIDSIAYAPRIHLLGAGHSLKSRLSLSGLEDKKKTKHWAAYEKRSRLSAFQAATLTPQQGPSNTKPRTATTAFLAPVIGPGYSRAVRDMPVITSSTQSRNPSDDEINQPRHEILRDEDGNLFGTITDKTNDPLAEKSRLIASNESSPPLSISFEGIDNLRGIVPPDPEGAVGLNHYLQVVNTSFAVYSKTGTLLSGPTDTNNLWEGFGGSCENDNSGDAIFLYDQLADRWILSQFSTQTGQAVCIAVSESADPLGNFFLYQINTQRFPDYFKLGMWPDPQNNAFFMATNSGFAAQYDVYALDRENMLLGQAARPSQFFQGFRNFMMPADFDGQLLPPVNSAGYFYTVLDGGEPYFGVPEQDSIDVYAFNVDWQNPNLSSFSLMNRLSPPEISNFNWTVCGFFRQNCLAQPDTNEGLDSQSWWPMQRLQYRNFGTYETLLGSWVVNALAQGRHAAPRWFELRKASNSWQLHQEGSLALDSDHRFIPSAAMDAGGNIAIAYSVSSSTTFPSLRYSTRDRGDPLGLMEQEASIVEGTGSQTSFRNRWGDYASMEIDPADDCTFWFTSQYIAATGSQPWKTRISALTKPSCKSLRFESTQITSCSSGVAQYTAQLSDIFQGSTQLTVNDCPGNALCEFTSNPIQFPSNTTQLNINQMQQLNSGNYPISITIEDSINTELTQNVNIGLNIMDTPPSSPELILPNDNTPLTLYTPLLSWQAQGDSPTYRVEIDQSINFNSIQFSLNTISTELITPPLDVNACYYWRVRANNICGDSEDSVTRAFSTGTPSRQQRISTDVPVTIPAIGTPTVSSTLQVSGVGPISDLNVINVSGIHDFIGDVSLLLTSPSGTRVQLMQASCANQNDFSIGFDDESEFSNWPCPPTDGMNYQPNEALIAFDGENADGLWTLTIVDQSHLDGGELQAWGLDFETLSMRLDCPSIEIFNDGFE